MDWQTFGMNVAEWQARSRLRTHELATLAGMPATDLEQAKLGRLPLAQEQIDHLAAALSCRPDDLVRGCGGRPRRVYIAGRVHGCPNAEKAFWEAEELLCRKGLDPANPMRATMSLPYRGMSRKDLIDTTMGILRTCDEVCLLPGWEASTGAKAEAAYAKAVLMPVRLLGEYECMPDMAPGRTPEVQAIRVRTPMGEIVAYPSRDPAHPGVYIDLGNDPVSMSEVVSDEADADGTVLVTRVWEDAGREEYTHRVVHRRPNDDQG